MRELKKFRAWDVEAKCYIEDPFLVDNFGQVYVVCEEASNRRGTCLITHKPNVILEQCTVIRDKNGKVICEGDIIRTSDEGIYKVRQIPTGAWRIGRDDLLVWADVSEVIGNINENPELLEDE